MLPELERLVVDHIELAKSIAHHAWKATPGLEYKELEAVALSGLVDAASRWGKMPVKGGINPSTDGFFKMYARERISGTIKDHIRKQDWATRSLREKNRKIQAVRAGSRISLAELSVQTGMPEKEIQIVELSMAHKPTSLEGQVLDPEEEIEACSDVEVKGRSTYLLQTIESTIRSLDKTTQEVLALRYYLGDGVQAIARRLGMRPAQVYALHTAGVRTVRDALVEASCG